MKRQASTRERAHMGRVAALGCVVCRNAGFGSTPSVVHHIREGQGGAQRASHWLTIPLCPSHHDGDDSVHKDRRGFELRYGDELALLAHTISELMR